MQWRRSCTILLLPIFLCPAPLFAQDLLIDRGAPGVLARFYDVGQDMRALPHLAPKQLPNVAKIVLTVDFDADDFPFSDHFITKISGYITVTEAGMYIFRLVSDDGARFSIDGKLLIDHDGLHGPDPKDAHIELTALKQHMFRIHHFENTGDERLALLWKPPHNDSFTTVPASVLTHNKLTSLETAPGQKRIIPPLRRGRPGDGTPLMRVHPGFQSLITIVEEYKPSPDSWLVDGRLRVMCVREYREFRFRGTTRPLVAWLPPVSGPNNYLMEFKLAQTPYQNHLRIHCQQGESKRIFLDDTATADQGCCFRFGVTEPFIRPFEQVAFEMLSVRALANGFEIEFTKPLDPRIGWDPEAYYLEQWPFDVKKKINPTRDGTRYPVKSAGVFDGRRKVFLEIDNLKPTHVVYIRLLPPCLSADGELPWSTEAWYTLNEIPQYRVGKVLSPPAPEPRNSLTEQERDAGFKLLFDGKTTKGWRGYKKDHFPAGWIVKDGCLVRATGGGDIISAEQFENFELKLEWRICAGGNSGIFYRVDEQVGPPWETGPEMQVLDNTEHHDGRNTNTSAGANYALHAPIHDVTEPVGLFNQTRILVNGNHVEHWLNGVKIVEYELGGPDWQKRVADSKFKQWPQYGRIKKGHIVLQDHGDQVWYRNIKIRELDK